MVPIMGLSIVNYLYLSTVHYIEYIMSIKKNSTYLYKFLKYFKLFIKLYFTQGMYYFNNTILYNTIRIIKIIIKYII